MAADRTDRLRLRDLPLPEREAAVPVLKEGFVGVYRWHAKRTLREVRVVRAAEIDGALAGLAMLERLAPEVGYVYYVAVGLRYRRQGVGAALLDDAVARFRRDGAEVVYAAVEEENLASRRLFESRGFRVVERDEPSFREGGLGARGFRTRMWIVHGELLLGLRVAPPSARGVPSGVR